MNRLQTILIAGLLIFSQSVTGLGVDYTSRSNTMNACELFAKDVYQAADNFMSGVALADLLELMEAAPVAPSQKHRAFQAIKFVWNNELDNPVLASTLAMGLCLKPKQIMAPLDDPWVTSPRTSREYF